MLLYGIAVLLCAVFAVTSAMRFGRPAQQPASDNPIPYWRLWTNRYAYVLGLLFFLYVGTESAVAGWAASYAHRVDPSSTTLWAMTPAFFWAALLAGRAVAPLLLKAMHETTLASAGLILATAGTLLLIFADGLGAIVAAVSLAGFGLASVFPINVAMLSHWFADRATRIGPTMFALAGLGGGVLPWAVGQLSTRFSELKIGLAVPLFGTVTCLLLYLTHRSRTPEVSS
jgi:fucose permease